MATATCSSDPLGRSILSNSLELHCFTDEPSRFGGGGRIRTYEGVSRQIYSLLPLAAWVPLRENEPRILISTHWGVNASWRGICWLGVGSGPFFQKWHSQRPRQGLLGRYRG